MADGSWGDYTGPNQMNDITFSAIDVDQSDTNKRGNETFKDDEVMFSQPNDEETSDNWVKSEPSSAVVKCNPASVGSCQRTQISEDSDSLFNEERKKRCYDRYDSSESSDSGVATLSSAESGGCSGSDITEPGSPCSPASSCGANEECASARMPPWACEPLPAAPRRVIPQSSTRRITEYFSHKMKAHHGLKRDSSGAAADDNIKRKCLNKNGISPDFEKYLSYLSQTLNPRVLLDDEKQHSDAITNQNLPDLIAPIKSLSTTTNNRVDSTKSNNDSSKETTAYPSTNGFGNKLNKLQSIEVAKQSVDYITTSKVHDGTNNLQNDDINIAKQMLANSSMNVVLGTKKDFFDFAKQNQSVNRVNGTLDTNQGFESTKTKQTSLNGFVGAKNSTINIHHQNAFVNKGDLSKNTLKPSTKLDTKMNGVTCGSNNLSLCKITPKPTLVKKDTQRKSSSTLKRANRKTSSWISSNKELSWSKSNNLKQFQLQKQNSNQIANDKCESTQKNTPKMNISNGLRNVPFAINGNISNVPSANLQNCHHINVPQQHCNNAVTPASLTPFMTVPQTVMLTTLRIPQGGMSAQTVNQPSNINPFNHSNVNVNSPNKLNSQFVFPLVQNLNGAVVQIPNLMAKMAPNFVLPQTSQIPQRQDTSLQNHQSTQMLINGTFLKIANTMTADFSNINKSGTSTTIPVMNKNVSNCMPNVGMTVTSKPSYTIAVSHPMLVPQTGYFINSVPNMHIKESWSNISTNNSISSESNISCSNAIVQHPPTANNNLNQIQHSSSIPMSPVIKSEAFTNVLTGAVINETSNGKSVPWICKNVNNNDVSFNTDSGERPFAKISKLTEGNKDLELIKNQLGYDICDKVVNGSDTVNMDQIEENLNRVKAVERREETIFTQITVLKDVSSNVRNTTIETEFSSVTNESSESGIGTDKSLDSPSDSQTSKECDEDSTLSLSISISSIEVQSSQKSPILKQPKTLRFPPKNLVQGETGQRTPSSDTTTSITICLWENCKQEFENDTDLLEHLQVIHVEGQAGRENYVCLWEQCKVRGKPSCSRLWLERHALSHGGNKPYKCIVDSCDRRFSTQILLERHVNNHFNEQSPNTNTARKAADSAPKLIRKNGKKLRYRRHPWSARMFDFFDAGIMEGLAWRLARCSRWRLGGSCILKEPAGQHTLTLHAALTATRYNTSKARREALVTYYPPHVLDDEWIPEREVKRIKRVEIATLPSYTKVSLYDQFCATYRAAPASTTTVNCSTSASTATSMSITSTLRKLPTRHCTGPRLLNKLIAKQKKTGQRTDQCNSSILFSVYGHTETQNKTKSLKTEVSGAAKRKQGRRYGGNAFWPCGR